MAIDQFNIAIENCHFIVSFPIKNGDFWESSVDPEMAIEFIIDFPIRISPFLSGIINCHIFDRGFQIGKRSAKRSCNYLGRPAGRFGW